MRPQCFGRAIGNGGGVRRPGGCLPPGRVPGRPPDGLAPRVVDLALFGGLPAMRSLPSAWDTGRRGTYRPDRAPDARCARTRLGVALWSSYGRDVKAE